MHSFSERERALLEEARVARLATLGATGPGETLRPHCVPVCFAVHEDLLWIALDEKPKANRKLRRIRNIEQNPAVTLLVDHYEEEWEKLWFLMIEGTALLTSLGPGVLSELRRRYPQYEIMNLKDGISVQPERVVFWSAEP